MGDSYKISMFCILEILKCWKLWTTPKGKMFWSQIKAMWNQSFASCIFGEWSRMSGILLICMSSRDQSNSSVKTKTDDCLAFRQKFYDIIFCTLIIKVFTSKIVLKKWFLNKKFQHFYYFSITSPKRTSYCHYWNEYYLEFRKCTRFPVFFDAFFFFKPFMHLKSKYNHFELRTCLVMRQVCTQ